MAFLFVWQFILSGPLEIASGYIGFANYAGYIWHGLTARGAFAIAAVVGVVNVALLYRRIAFDRDDHREPVGRDRWWRWRS